MINPAVENESGVYEINRYCGASEFSKSNLLINARYSATLLENQILAVALQQVKKKDSVLESHITVPEIKRIFHKTSGSIYSQLKKASYNLLNYKFMIENPENNEFKAYNLLGSCESKNGDFTVRFNPDLEELVVNLTANFTTLSITELAKLDSVQSFRLYETLKSKSYYRKNYKGEKNGKYIIEYELSELRVMMGAVDLNRAEISKLINNVEHPDYDEIIRKSEELYEKDKKAGIKSKPPKWPRWSHVRDDVLTPACKEISEKTDIYVEYEPVKSGIGGKVGKIYFYITDKNFSDHAKVNQQDVPEQADTDDMDDLMDQVRDIIEQKVASKEIRHLLKVADYDIEKIKNAYEIAQGQDVDNLIGFLTSAIKEGYKKPVKAKKKQNSKLANKHEYNYDELEELVVNKYN